MKKIFLSLFLTVLVTTSSLIMFSYSASALGPGSTIVKCETIGTNQTSSKNFLAFPAWYRGLDCDASSGNINLAADQEVGQIVFTIALNIVDIALRLAGVLAVGFVVWGGLRYVMARGEPDKAKQALSTILNALIGLAIAMAAKISPAAREPSPCTEKMR
jgi:hypothetical protein